MTINRYIVLKMVAPISACIVSAISSGLMAYGMSVGMPYRCPITFIVAGCCSWLGGWLSIIIGISVQPPEPKSDGMPQLTNYFQLEEKTNDKILYVRGTGNYITGDIVDIPIDFEMLQKVARHSVRHKPFSFEALGCVGLSRRDIEKIQAWARGKEYIRKKGKANRSGYLVTNEGRQFFTDVLATSPTNQQKYRHTGNG
jgi:hypothetical protein